MQEFKCDPGAHLAVSCEVCQLEIIVSGRTFPSGDRSRCIGWPWWGIMMGNECMHVEEMDISVCGKYHGCAAKIELSHPMKLNIYISIRPSVLESKAVGVQLWKMYIGCGYWSHTWQVTNKCVNAAARRKDWLESSSTWQGLSAVQVLSIKSDLGAAGCNLNCLLLQILKQQTSKQV